MKKILVRGPALTRSGYGEHTRFLIRSLRKYEDTFYIFLINTTWGQTGWIFEESQEREWIDKTLQKTILYNQNNGVYDMSLQVTIPNEWEKLAPINIGVTAGIETTAVSPAWLEKSKLMDKIITISNHSKFVFERSRYDGVVRQTQEKFVLKCETPIDVVHYPVRIYEPSNLDLELDTDFNFLSVAQWSPRKNVENAIKWFVEEFIDQEVGLVLKLFKINNSIIDRVQTEKTLKQILAQYPQRKCKIYMLHGDMSDEEMTALYQHPKIKALISMAHGEGFGLPIFEAVYNGIPILAPDWSGQVDFLHMPVTKNGKTKKKPHFARIDYDIGPVQKEVVWDGVIQEESMWCYPKQGSYKMRLREVYKEYGRFNKQAKILKKWALKEFSEEKQYDKFVNSYLGVFPNMVDEKEIQVYG